MSASPEDDMSATAALDVADAAHADGGHATSSPAATATTTTATATPTPVTGTTDSPAAGTGTGTAVGAGAAVFEPAKPSTFLHVHRPRELEVQPMSTPRAPEQRPLGPLDREQIEGLVSSSSLLSVVGCSLGTLTRERCCCCC